MPSALVMVSQALTLLLTLMRHIICDMIKRMYALVVNIRVSGPLSSQSSKKFKRNLKKYSEKFLIFSKKVFPIFWEMELSELGKKIFLKKFIVFSQKMFSLYLRNQNFVVALNFFQKFFFSYFENQNFSKNLLMYQEGTFRALKPFLIFQQMGLLSHKNLIKCFYTLNKTFLCS